MKKTILTLCACLFLTTGAAAHDVSLACIEVEKYAAPDPNRKSGKGEETGCLTALPGSSFFGAVSLSKVKCLGRCSRNNPVLTTDPDKGTTRICLKVRAQTVVGPDGYHAIYKLCAPAGRHTP